MTSHDPMLCANHRCGWVGDLAETLAAPDPFDDGETLRACPRCKGTDVRVRCDEPACRTEATCGTPTARGYRWTCYAHRPQ